VISQRDSTCPRNRVNRACGLLPNKRWEPSVSLKTQYPDDERLRVSHETIYRSLFIQARGVLTSGVAMASFYCAAAFSVGGAR
jgi:hypothetical protein